MCFGDRPPAGATTELVQDGDVWVSRMGTLTLTARGQAGVWHVYDGAGRTYTFVEPAQLDNAGLWLLKSVSASGRSSICLNYQITTWPIDGGTGLEVDLTQLVYNTTSLRRGRFC
jgi:hypothetical protein